ncbi:hypothetical protein D3C76_1309170 [compost metagenome]
MHAAEQGEHANVVEVFRDTECPSSAAYGQNVISPGSVEGRLQQLIEGAIGQLANQIALNIGAGYDRTLADP